MAKAKPKLSKNKSAASKPVKNGKEAKDSKHAKESHAKKEKVAAASKTAETKVKASPKPAEVPKKAPKKEKPVKKGKTGEDEIDLGDDLEGADFDGGSEIAEYEDELRAVESEDDDSGDDAAWSAETQDKDSEEVILTDAEGNRYCRARDCDQIANVDAYCRYHYLLFWKKIQVRKKILTDGKLERYVEELTSRYPDKFLEMIRRDLRTEKDFVAAIQELEIDEAGLENEFEEDTQTYIDEVRGMGESASVDEEEF